MAGLLRPRNIVALSSVARDHYRHVAGCGVLVVFDDLHEGFVYRADLLNMFEQMRAFKRSYQLGSLDRGHLETTYWICRSSHEVVERLLGTVQSVAHPP